jgi:hypothetical protein
MAKGKSVILKIIISIAHVFCLVCTIHAQDEEMDSLLQTLPQLTTNKVSGAFKSTRVIQAHSIEMLHKSNLDVRILHRFGTINSGVDELFGLDNASTRIGFDYGVSENFTIGVGRSTYRKEFDAFLKVRLVQQGSARGNSPVSFVLALGSTIWTEDVFTEYKPTTADRTGYYLQALIGRKFSEQFSLQLSPIVVHQNYVASQYIDNTVFGLGGGTRFKVSKRIALTMDYHYVLGDLPETHYNPLGIGMDIETGGHVFQLHFSNAVGMNERAYIVDTNNDFWKGEIRFGFNISRLFLLGKKK